MHTTSTSLLGRLATDARDDDWRKLLDLYSPFIKRVVRSYPSVASQADDITQEVVMTLIRELPRFQRQREGSFRNWLRLMTINQMQTAYRKNKKFKQMPGADDTAPDFAALADPTSALSQLWDEEHNRYVLERVFHLVKSEFEDKTWQAFHAYAIEKRPPQEVAAELNLSLNAVFLAKSRIIRRMRAEASGLIDD